MIVIVVLVVLVELELGELLVEEK